MAHKGVDPQIANGGRVPLRRLHFQEEWRLATAFFYFKPAHQPEITAGQAGQGAEIDPPA